MFVQVNENALFNRVFGYKRTHTLLHSLNNFVRSDTVKFTLKRNYIHSLLISHRHVCYDTL